MRSEGPYTVKCSFNQDKDINFQNTYQWAHYNLYIIMYGRYQYQFQYNLWAGMIHDILIRPCFQPDNLNECSDIPAFVW